MKLLLIGGLMGLTIGVGLTLLYFSLAKFFAANAKALDRQQKATEETAAKTQKTQPPQTKIELVASEKRGNKTAATAGK